MIRAVSGSLTRWAIRCGVVNQLEMLATFICREPHSMSHEWLTNWAIVGLMAHFLRWSYSGRRHDAGDYFVTVTPLRTVNDSGSATSGELAGKPCILTLAAPAPKWHS